MKTVISSEYAAFYKAAGEKKFGKDLQENFAYFERLYAGRLYVNGVPTTPLQFPVKSETVVFVEEDKFGYYTQSMTVRRVGSKFFFRSILTKRFTFKGGKMYGEIFPYDKCLAELISHVPHLEWFKSILEDKSIRDGVLTTIPNKLWLKIFNGKITNPKMFWNEWSKVSYKNMVPGWALKVYKTSHISIYDAELVCDDLCSLAQKIKSLDERSIDLVRDLVKDCISLRGNYKIDPKKSMSQLENDHLKNCERIEAKNLDPRAIYDNDTLKLFEMSMHTKENKLKLISSAVESFREAKRFKNCSYNHYWEPTANGSYVLMVSELYDAMIGMRRDSTGWWRVEQIFGRCNMRVSEDIFDKLKVASTDLINHLKPKVKVLEKINDNRIVLGNMELIEEEPELLW